MDARQRARLGYINIANNGVRVRAGQQTPVQHIAQFNIVHIGRFARYQFHSIDLALGLAHNAQFG